MLKFTRIVIIMSALVGLVGFANGGVAQAPPDETGDVCLFTRSGLDGCTANDFDVEILRVVNVDEACNQGTYGWLQVDLQVVLSTASPTRYDPSFFLGLDGSPTAALDGTNCYHGFLQPPLTETPFYQDWHGDGLLNDIVDDDWWTDSQDADLCGDMDSQTSTVKTVYNLRIPCTDNDGSGFADMHTCASYDNNHQTTCNDVTQAIPGTASKCRCSIKDFDPGIPFVPTAITLSAFDAAPQHGDILVTWKIDTGFNLLGFHLYRGESQDGPEAQLNDDLLGTQAEDGSVAASFQFLDESVVTGVTYYYWLDVVDTSGTATRYGPVSAAVPAEQPEATSLSRVFLPIVNK